MCVTGGANCSVSTFLESRFAMVVGFISDTLWQFLLLIADYLLAYGRAFEVFCKRIRGSVVSSIVRLSWF